MFSNIRIGRRLLLLITVLTVVFLAVGTVTVIGMTEMSDNTSELNDKMAEAAEFSQIAVSVRHNLVKVGQSLNVGRITWQEASDNLEFGLEEFNRLWSAHQSKISGNPKLEEFFSDAFELEVELVREGYAALAAIVKAESRPRLSLYILNEEQEYTDPFLNSADALAALGSSEAQVVFDDSESAANLYLSTGAIVIIIGLILAVTLGPLIYVSITSPIKNISGVIAKVAQGDLGARTGLKTKDELGQLANAFDGLLSERVSTMAQAEDDNEQINNSVIELLEAVSALSDRDLTVKVPVAEDVTGPVADAMNLMASETARVLREIRTIADQVAEAASSVQTQGTKVNQLASSERVIVEDTMVKLDEASKSMTLIAKLAKASNDIATKASESTLEALDTVSKTANGMNEIRETISETEKRIKRLGERSQEINGIVAIINNIAERTHVLALNASMQAAAAGDAGRGFAVVADEVQRLAESSRQSTSEIGGLVSNIQTETAETMATMNRTIAQVVDGTELAQASGVQMEATQKTTAELANAVNQIARRSLVQVSVNNSLREQAQQVQTSTNETSSELELQSAQTANLVEYSDRLIKSVSVFKLPA